MSRFCLVMFVLTLTLGEVNAQSNTYQTEDISIPLSQAILEHTRNIINE